MSFLITAAALILAQPYPAPSIHQVELGNHMDELPPVRYYGPAGRHATKSLKSLNYIVYGYLPYWVGNLSGVRWDDLSHVAYFSVELNSNGSYSTAHGWPDNTLVSTAHSHGVKVELVFTLFESSSIRTLVNSSSYRARAIGNMIDLMESGNADGISIDFEGVPSSARSGFTTFIRELRQELTNRGHPNAGITIAAPAVDWSGAFDVAQLVQYSKIFIMAYDYFWSGSDYAGPTGIFRTSTQWRPASQHNTVRSVARYASLAGDDLRHQIILGVPYYGREYKTRGSSWPSSAISNVGTATYSDIMGDGGATHRDDDICEAARIWQRSGTWHQLWFMDETGLACRLQLVLDERIGGFGMWALGYDGSRPELWDTMEDYSTSPPAPEDGDMTQPIRITSFPYSDSRNTEDGHRYFNYYSCSDSMEEAGKEIIYRVDVCSPGTLSAHVPTYNFQDPDVHILSDQREDACLARAHTDAETHVNPGTYYIVVDTYVSSGVELEGTYSLDVNFQPDSGSSSCPSGTHCDGGQCVSDNQQCSGTQIECNGQCVDPASDRDNCGSCGNECGDEQSCINGQCVDAGNCTNGQIECNGQCVDPASDRDNCGSCGNECGDEQSCINGQCMEAGECGTGQIECYGLCVDPFTDSNNCGGCAIICSDDQICVNGQCKASDDSTTYSQTDDECYTKTECACRAPGSRGSTNPALVFMLAILAVIFRKYAR